MYLILKRASASRSSGGWNDDDFDVLADGEVVGRMVKAALERSGRETVVSVEECRLGARTFCFHYTKGVRHVEVADGGYCVCNRNATCFGADHSPSGRRPSHRAERAELRCGDSR